MRRKFLLPLVLLIGLVFISTESFAGWTQAKGHSYNQLTYSYYRTTQKFTTINFDGDENIIDTDHDIERKATEEFSSKKVSYYGEYGVTDTFTVFLSGGWDWQRTNDTIKYSGEDGPSGIGDINIGLRQNLIKNIPGTGVIMSFQTEVKIPEAYDYGNPTTHQSLGDGQYDWTGGLVFGRGLGKGYAVFSVMYKYRFENDEHDPLTFKPSDQMKYSLSGGYSLTSWMSLRANIEWAESLDNAEVSDELVAANWATGGEKRHNDVVIIKDSLGLAQDTLSAGVSLAINLAPKWQTVVSYNEVLTGYGHFVTKDSSLGKTSSIALVYMH
ncbi:MAG: hypothetical protein ABFR82_01125 [Nitrospirota bacterium]